MFLFRSNVLYHAGGFFHRCMTAYCREFEFLDLELVTQPCQLLPLQRDVIFDSHIFRLVPEEITTDVSLRN